VRKTPLTQSEIRQLESRYRELVAQISGLESISQGSVMPHPPWACRWTWKVDRKTITRGLTATKAEKMKCAIANQRTLDQTIDALREITQKLILLSPESAASPLRKNPPKSRLS